MSKNKRDRQMASIVLAAAIEKRYDQLALAVGEDDTIAAATDLAMIFQDNVEQILWALRTAGKGTPDLLIQPNADNQFK